MIRKPGIDLQTASINNQAFITTDGAQLPLHRWLPENAIQAVIIALHGFNDYGHFIDDAGSFLSRHNIATYAYDQRGFGGSENTGYWAGVDAYLDDLRSFVQLIQQRHPEAPLYVLGESMGGAVVLAASVRENFPAVSGLILSAPAVWGRTSMPWYQRVLLAVSAHTVPDMQVTGSGLKITPSDNIDMLRALWKDPLIIKETRVDAVYGLVNLMDEALQASSAIDVPVCLLYGEKDEIVPWNAVAAMLNLIEQRELVTLALYEQGYHMLLRDLQAETVWTDIANWIQHPKAKLPSNAEQLATKRFKPFYSSPSTAQ